MYCSCSAEYSSAPPNTHACPVCLGLPGALPVINKAAIETCVMTGLALNCEIPSVLQDGPQELRLPRPAEGLPDLAVRPAALPRRLARPSNRTARMSPAGITRVHIEEDTGRLVHARNEAGQEISLVDLNRSGVPLMEIVGEPDLRSPGASAGLSDRAAADPALYRRVDREHGRGRVSLRRQHLGARDRRHLRRRQRSRSRT